jgi:hypothetical protein
VKMVGGITGMGSLGCPWADSAITAAGSLGKIVSGEARNTLERVKKEKRGQWGRGKCGESGSEWGSADVRGESG